MKIAIKARFLENKPDTKTARELPEPERKRERKRESHIIIEKCCESLSSDCHHPQNDALH